MTWPWLGVIGLTMVASLVTTWLMIAAVIPSLRLRNAATVNLGSSAVANTLPGGGAVAMGVSWAMLSGWGVGTSEYVRYTLVSGLWNVFVRLGLPVVALAILVITGRPQHGLTGGRLLRGRCARRGRAHLTRHTAQRSRSPAGSTGRWAACWPPDARLARRPPPQRAQGALADFRAGASGLLARRWLRITAAAVASHLTLWLVLLACVRASGLGQGQVSWQASLAAFAFVRLVSVLPLTPGGVGGSGRPDRPADRRASPAAVARVAAAVLLYRAVTYLLPIPLGALAYVWWRRTHQTRRRSHPVG